MTCKDADSRITPDPSRMSVMFWTLTAATNLSAHGFDLFDAVEGLNEEHRQVFWFEA